MMNMSLTNNFVSVSEFSQGKANKIFSDVAENNQEYVVLKNNKPSAVVMSVIEYEEIRKKIEKLESIIEKISDFKLLKLAESRNTEGTISFADAVKEQGFSMEEIEILSESVEID